MKHTTPVETVVTSLPKKKKKKVPKKKTNGQLKKKLWKVFSQFIRKRDEGICFTCGRHAEGSGYHAGHFIPKSVGGISLYFHEENVKGQCYNCNINLGGNSYIFGVKLGEAKVGELYALKQKITKDYPFTEKIRYYEELLKNEQDKNQI